MNIFDSMEVLASGLTAERVRMNVVSSNLANAQTTHTEEGGPYKRRDPLFAATPLDPMSFDEQLTDALNTVVVDDIVQDPTAARQVYNPSHPDANTDGFVAMPNVSMVEEMVNMMTASRSYEAGVTAMKTLVDMAEKALSIGR